MARRVLYVSQVLAWADAFHRRMGYWPRILSPALPAMRELPWRSVDNALRYGLRGLPGGSSLAQLLTEARGARNVARPPKLTIKQVLGWADAHFNRNGRWPNETTGPIPEAAGESWHGVDRALRAGVRGFPGGSSLARLLAKQRGVPNRQALPRLSVRQILAWADQHHRRHGEWPNSRSGPLEGVKDETWSALNSALVNGRRGLPGRSSLPRVLAQYRGVRNPKQPRPLKLNLILRWAGAHHKRTGQWPKPDAGPLREAPGETWAMIDRAMRYAKRGLPRRRSLYRVLKETGKLGDGHSGDGHSRDGHSRDGHSGHGNGRATVARRSKRTR
jgi:hypothetical protein